MDKKGNLKAPIHDAADMSGGPQPTLRCIEAPKTYSSDYNNCLARAFSYGLKVRDTASGNLVKPSPAFYRLRYLRAMC